MTIDDDVARLVEQEQRRSGETFKGTVNRLLRHGLMNAKEKTVTKPFVVTPFPLGVGEMLDRHDGSVSALLEELEGPYHR